MMDGVCTESLDAGSLFGAKKARRTALYQTCPAHLTCNTPSHCKRRSDSQPLRFKLLDDEVVAFVDAVHPTHAARPVGCWAPKEQKLAIEQTSGRQRINIHGAINLESGQTRMIEAVTIDAISTIRMVESLEALYPLMVCIQVFLDNARYHHAKLVHRFRNSNHIRRPGRACRTKHGRRGVG